VLSYIYIIMPRRHKETPAEKTFEDIVKVSAEFPWWLSFGIALLLFLFVPSVSNTEGSLTAGYVVALFFLAMFKYLVPFALFIGGITNLLRGGKSLLMFDNISRYGAKNTLRELDWRDFEFLVAEYFRKNGYRAQRGPAGPDGGVDVRLYKSGGLYLVQCKHYKVWKVSARIVRELYGVMSAEGAVGGFVVTTGRFTKEAISFAEGKSVKLIDGNKLETMLDYKGEDVSIKKDIICPQCGHELVVRNGSRGKFWGCSSFPKCHYTRDFK